MLFDRKITSYLSLHLSISLSLLPSPCYENEGCFMMFSGTVPNLILSVLLMSSEKSPFRAVSRIRRYFWATCSTADSWDCKNQYLNMISIFWPKLGTWRLYFTWCKNVKCTEVYVRVFRKWDNIKTTQFPPVGGIFWCYELLMSIIVQIVNLTVFVTKSITLRNVPFKNHSDFWKRFVSLFIQTNNE